MVTHASTGIKRHSYCHVGVYWKACKIQFEICIDKLLARRIAPTCFHTPGLNLLYLDSARLLLSMAHRPPTAHLLLRLSDRYFTSADFLHVLAQIDHFTRFPRSRVLHSCILRSLASSWDCCNAMTWTHLCLRKQIWNFVFIHALSVNLCVCQCHSLSLGFCLPL